MPTGNKVHLLDPSPLDYEIEDIALSLSRETRWNGQTTGMWPFSVCQHRILTERVKGLTWGAAPIAARKAVLLHDAAECVLRDIGDAGESGAEAVWL